MINFNISGIDMKERKPEVIYDSVRLQQGVVVILWEGLYRLSY